MKHQVEQKMIRVLTPNHRTEVKHGYYQNLVPTTWEQNMAAAKTCEDINKAIGLFRALQYANDMGTHGGHFDELEKHFKK